MTFRRRTRKAAIDKDVLTAMLMIANAPFILEAARQSGILEPRKRREDMPRCIASGDSFEVHKVDEKNLKVRVEL